MTKGTLVRWLKKEGDLVKPGQVLFEVETDKAVLGYEVQEESYVARLLVSEGSADLDIGSPVAILVDSQGLIPAFKDYTVTTEAPQEPLAAPKAAAEPVPSADAKIWPSAKLILDQAHMSPSDVKSSNQVITKQDALEAVSHRSPPPPEQSIKAEGDRLAFAKVPRASVTKTPTYQIVPRFSVTSDLDLDGVQK
jgi:pyruvate/2-oxoglutarate dehydrogenase complex dihydrolipoamide acyltransferase (E2) component